MFLKKGEMGGIFLVFLHIERCPTSNLQSLSAIVSVVLVNIF